MRPRKTIALGALGALLCAAGSIAQESGGAMGEAPAPVATEKIRRTVPDTLMFTIDEFNDIKDRIASGDVTKERKLETLDAATLYLGSILYSNPKSWTVWINGSPIGPDQDFQAFQVTEITPRYVELLVPLSVQGMRPVRLEPNQTFITESGIIVEGKYP